MLEKSKNFRKQEKFPFCIPICLICTANANFCWDGQPIWQTFQKSSPQYERLTFLSTHLGGSSVLGCKSQNRHSSISLDGFKLMLFLCNSLPSSGDSGGWLLATDAGSVQGRLTNQGGGGLTRKHIHTQAMDEGRVLASAWTMSTCLLAPETPLVNFQGQSIKQNNLF